MSIVSSIRSKASNLIADFHPRLNRAIYLSHDDKFLLNPTITFCITCMGRLYHLKETLPRNLEDSKDCPNVDFVLLDYNSPDNMGDWVCNNLKVFLDTGKVKYYRTDEFSYYHPAHAKNVAHKLATGDIVCNLDADNFIGKGFASYLASLFKEDSRRVVKGNWKVNRDANGRVILLKKYFLFLGGYNELLQGWGCDDNDLFHRSVNLGLKTAVISDKKFLETIKHDDDDRVKFMHHDYKNIKMSISHNDALTKAWPYRMIFKVNQGLCWGKARVSMNFGERIIEV